jgi:hypothetical protein
MDIDCSPCARTKGVPMVAMGNMVIITVLLLTWCFAPAHSNSSPTNCTLPAVQISALEDFFVALNGSMWEWDNTGSAWNFTEVSADPCGDWQGIICSSCTSSDYYSSVVSLNISSVGARGHIPYDLLNNFTLLSLFDASDNSISGSMPNIDSLSHVTIFSVESNNIRGAIADDGFSGLSALVALFLNNNYFSGPIPSSVFSSMTLRYLYASENRFSSSLPSIVGAAKNLEFIYLDSNSLTGPLPESLNALTKLIFFSVSSNMLTGRMGLLDYWPSLEYLSLRDNEFSGSLSSSVSTCKNLTFLRIDDNNFSGQMPTSLSSLTKLQGITISGNKFTGPATFLFEGESSPSSFPLLTSINMDNNGLTGTVPRQIFELPSLRLLSLSQNCFKGRIPEEVCSATKLTSLVLDGLTSGSSCRQYLALGLSKAYVPHNFITGSIPSCILTLPNVSVFHISGNGIRASFSSFASSVSSAMQDISLSYNQITGTIPYALNTLPIPYRDFSFNRIGGTIEQMKNLPAWNVSSNYSLFLDVNRLSGYIPTQFHDEFYQINILSGNLFQCSEATIPENDPSADSYVCGSQELNESAYAAASTCACFFVFLFVAWWFKPKPVEKTAKKNAKKNKKKSRQPAEPNTVANEIQAANENCRASSQPDSDDEDSDDEDDIERGGISMTVHSRKPTKSNDGISNHDRCSDIGAVSFVAPVVVPAAASNSIRPVSSGTKTISSKRSVAFAARGLPLNPQKQKTEDEQAVAELEAETELEDETEDIGRNSFMRGSQFDQHGSLSTVSMLSPRMEADENGELVPNPVAMHQSVSSIGRSASGDDVSVHSSQSGIKHTTSDIAAEYYDMLNLFIHENLESILFRCTGLRLFTKEILDMPKLFRFIKLLHQFRQIFFIMLAACMIILLPLFCLFSYYPHYGTFTDYSYKYGWAGTAAYSTGTTVAVCYIIIWIFMAVLSVWRLLTIKGLLKVEENLIGIRFKSSESQAKAKSTQYLKYRQLKLQYKENRTWSNFFALSHSFKVFGICCFVVIVDVVAMVALNIGYVVGELSSLNGDIKFLLQCCTAMIKLVWNFIILRFFIRRITLYKGDPKDKKVNLFIALVAFNNIAAPVIATMMTDSRCFRSVIIPDNPIVSTFSIISCGNDLFTSDLSALSNYCSKDATDVISFSFAPPFIYSYECGSAIITNFIPMFNYSYALMTMIPLLYIVLAQVDHRKIPKWLLWHLPGTLWPLADHTLFKKVLNPDIEIIQQLLHLFLLLTFGVTCAQLAVVICFSAIASSIVSQVFVVRFIRMRMHHNTEKKRSIFSVFNPMNPESSTRGMSFAAGMESARNSTASNAPGFRESAMSMTNNFEDFPDTHSASKGGASVVGLLENACSGSWRRLLNGGVLVVIGAVTFYAVMTYDAAAAQGAQGELSGLWVPIVCFFPPTIFYLVRYYYCKMRICFSGPKLRVEVLAAADERNRDAIDVAAGSSSRVISAGPIQFEKEVTGKPGTKSVGVRRNIDSIRVSSADAAKIGESVQRILDADSDDESSGSDNEDQSVRIKLTRPISIRIT